MAKSRNTPRKKRTNIQSAMKAATRKQNRASGSDKRLRRPTESRLPPGTAEQWRAIADKILGPRDGLGRKPGYVTLPIEPGTRKVVDPAFNRGPQDGNVEPLPVKAPGRLGPIDPNLARKVGGVVGLGPARRVGDDRSPLRGDPELIEQMGGPDQPDANSNYHEFVKAHGGKSTARLGGLFSQNTGRRLTPKMRRALAQGALTRTR